MIKGKYSVVCASVMTTLLEQLTIEKFFIELDMTRVFALCVL